MWPTLRYRTSAFFVNNNVQFIDTPLVANRLVLLKAVLSVIELLFFFLFFSIIRFPLIFAFVRLQRQHPSRFLLDNQGYCWWRFLRYREWQHDDDASAIQIKQTVAEAEIGNGTPNPNSWESLVSGDGGGNFGGPDNCCSEERRGLTTKDVFSWNSCCHRERLCVPAALRP